MRWLIILCIAATAVLACDWDGDGFNSTNSTCQGMDCDDYNSSVNPSSMEIPDNGNDEDCDGWLNTSLGYRLRATHPRTLISEQGLEEVIDRMYGASARDPYQTWLQRVSEREISAQSGGNPSAVDLALMYKATGNTTYKDWCLTELDNDIMGAALQDQNGVGFGNLITLDIMWDDVNDSIKLKALALSSYYSAYSYASGANSDEQNFGYHGATGRDSALAFAVTYAFDDIMDHPDVLADPETYSFNVTKYIMTIAEEMHEGGTFHALERRIAGDIAYNSALPGSYGGMYDNFGYDGSEEAHSMPLISVFSTATGQEVYDQFYHDRYRGRFYQSFGMPHRTSYYGSGDDSYKTREMARIWFTQTGSSGPNRDYMALAATKYNDPYMQYYADRWRKQLNVYNYDYYITDIWWMLLFYNDSLPIISPEEIPTSSYFNGPGLVAMRSGWSDNATFAVFTAGEGISRRYEDANSFMIHRKTDVMPIAGARIRFHDDNYRMTWYATRSISKNTLKIFDPQECFDVDDEGFITGLHTGTPLVPSDNMGGQIFETDISTVEGDYSGGGDRHNCGGFDLGVCEVADIKKYEFRDGLYTYAVGNATPSYTRKIDYFDREFLYLDPGIFVIFDKVRSVNQSYRKVWVTHTIDQPYSNQTIHSSGNGMTAYRNASYMSIDNIHTATYIDSLLPKGNEVKVRGGLAVLTSGHPLNSSSVFQGDVISRSDIPRWLEVHAVGPDVEGSMTICGNASEGYGVCETLDFDGTTMDYVTSRPTDDYAGVLVDEGQDWWDDEWAGYVLRGRGGSNPDLVITGNNRTALFVPGYDPSGVWGYHVLRPMENTYYHFREIHNITTDDMDVDDLTVQALHYFDAEDAYGKLYSFTPHTAGDYDNFRGRYDLGRYTLSIEAKESRLHDNFLNVLHLTDYGNPRVATELIEAENESGVFINRSKLALFSNRLDSINSTEYTIDSEKSVTHMIFDLNPSYDYYIYEDGLLHGMIESSEMGSIVFNSTPGGVATYSVSISQDSFHPADENRDGQVSSFEIRRYLLGWKEGSVTLPALLDALGVWKG